MFKKIAVLLCLLILCGCSTIQAIGPLPIPRNTFTQTSDLSWSYQVNLEVPHETQCISPYGELVGGWRSCRADGTCNYEKGIVNKCRLIYDGTEEVPTGNELIVMKVKLDQAMQPTNITDSDAGCASNSACKAVIDAAAEFVGVSSSVMKSAVAPIQQTRLNEADNFYFSFPDGYQYCRIMVETVSVVPETGDKAALMSIAGANRNLRVKTWTPRLDLSQGRGWIEANFIIVGVRNDMVPKYHSNGVCKDKYVRRICRGASGINNGSPACGIITD